ncbi:nicotinamide-nucleotide adenylyltransferase [Candidatus Woesearchaeota archaeon]|nr:nicotinamide-nucleotide adenylyltransferase [Candidatus Woesearchaeota archaeon]
MKRALFIGRFQPFHNAHLKVVKDILKNFDEITIAIGSSKEKNTAENPFSYIERKKMVEKALKSNKIKKYSIYPVPDLYNDRKWAGYIKKNLPEFDAVYSGNLWTLKCFRKNKLNAKKIRIMQGISSTIIRNRIIKNKSWKKYVPKEIADYIGKIKGAERIKKLRL